MTVKEIAFELENLQIEAEKIDSLQNALFSAIYRGEFAPETYEGAFIALGELTFATKNRLDEVGKELFKIVKKDQKGVA